DVAEVVLPGGVERVAAGEVPEGPVSVLEVPGVGDLDVFQPDLGLRRDLPDVAGDEPGELGPAAGIQKDQAVDQQVGVLAEGDGGAPFVPAGRSAFTLVEDAAQKADHREAPPGH